MLTKILIIGGSGMLGNALLRFFSRKKNLDVSTTIRSSQLLGISNKSCNYQLFNNIHLEDKKDIIPAITHVDGTCRIQTVTSEQNPHYYALISEFNKIKNVPILFNTSFNLAGDPLVETVAEALETLKKSEMKYLWLPEIGKLLTKGDFKEV